MNLKFSVILICLMFITSCDKEPKDLTLYVSGKTTDCSASESPCLKIKTDLNDSWTVYSGEIIGFSHEIDQDFTLKVKPVDNTEHIFNGDFELIELINQHKSPLELGEGSWNVFFVQEIESFDRAPFLTITEDQTSIHGSTGCNKFKSSLQAERGSFAIGDVALTKMACPNPDVETSFVKMLQKSSTYEILDDTLHLLAEDGTILVKAKHLNVRQ
ncbi:META domain-containing protein [Ichthyenterobacterium sp. W332]|uniref:META domain-containing protein n=1 Tax=Microcosmobacter mediterraneus TaxID=3075607 RepID=A0ABU2YK95_9FLAO|nr:META domain-containing protein [Ichthyenterobacterium sp. W332]MDT0558593.1 META domain-containing protein [Ichthyenterobacterium sp. W332]